MGKNKVLIDRVPEGNVSSGGGGSGLGEKAQADEGCGVDGEDVVGGGGFTVVVTVAVVVDAVVEGVVVVVVEVVVVVVVVEVVVVVAVTIELFYQETQYSIDAAGDYFSTQNLTVRSTFGSGGLGALGPFGGRGLLLEPLFLDQLDLLHGRSSLRRLSDHLKSEENK